MFDMLYFFNIFEHIQHGSNGIGLPNLSILTMYIVALFN